MAVVTSGNETIVRYGRALIALYYLLVVACGLIALVLAIAGFGQAVGDEAWSNKTWGVVGCAVGALSFAMTSIQMYTMAKSYSKTFVAFGPTCIRLQLPRSDGDLLRIGREHQLKWDEIQNVSYEGNWKRRVCQFTAGDYRYTLNQNNCPSPGIVADMLAKGKGVQLSVVKAAGA